MSLGLPDFGDLETPPFNPLIYPRRVIMEVLESMFSQQVLSVVPGMPSNPFLYIPEGNEPNLRSKLVIADSFSDELRKNDPRPTIVIGRGTFQFADMAIGAKRDSMPVKLLTKTNTKAIGTDDRTQSKYSDMTTVGIDIRCYSRRDTEVEQLAWLVAGALRFFRSQIRDGSRLHKLTSPVVGAVSVVKTDAQIDLFTAPVSLMIYQPMVWQVQATVSPQEIIAGISNLSGNPFPEVWSDQNPLSLTLSPSIT